MSDSKSSTLLKQAKRIKQKKFEEGSDLVLAEGKAIIEMALAARAEVLAIFVSNEDDVKLFSDLNLPVVTVSKKDLREISSTVTPQGVIALLRFRTHFVDSIPINSTTLIYLEEIRDPGNLGTIIRTADSFGIDAVLLSPGCVDVRNDKVIRSSAGSVFNLPVIADVSLQTLRDIKLKLHGDILVTSLSKATAIWDVQLSKLNPTIWAIGNEATGVSESLVKEATQLVTIPMLGKAESLNAATAAAVCLYVSAQHKNQVSA